MNKSKWYTSQVIEKARKDAEARAWLATDIIEKHVKKEIKSRGLIDTGNLRGSFDREKIGKNKIRFFNFAEYAQAVEFGSVPHKIEAKPGGVLAFKIAVGSDIKTRRLLYRSAKTGKLIKSKKNAETIVVKSVNHPGTKAQPFMRTGYRAAMPEVERRIK